MLYISALDTLMAIQIAIENIIFEISQNFQSKMDQKGYKEIELG